MKKKATIKKFFNAVDIRLASPDNILDWSYGEITKPETINYRTQKPERDGLFCEKVFGPENDFQCSCGKYKGTQYHGIVCDKCGVEVTFSSVRRDRMGHIELATPISHCWFLKKIPSQMSTILGIPTQKLQKVIYYSAYYVIEVDKKKKTEIREKLEKEIKQKIDEAGQKKTKLMLQALFKERMKELEMIEENTIMSENDYDVLSKQFKCLFVAKKGGEVIFELLKNINLKKLEKEIIKEMEDASEVNKEKLQKRLLLVKSFIKSENRPEWMFIKRIPVIPSGIRPVISIDGGRYASSDLNNLYRHIIVRNNKLKEFIATKTPSIFIDTQKRLLQESVDALFEQDTTNSIQTFTKGQAKKLKPISEYIAGKTGLFRANLLGKRVDFSGRSVIVVGPQLKIDEFGLPKNMALEIFKPFVISEIINREFAYNIRSAQRLIETEVDIVWEILEMVIQGKYMLLNRAPTLHRQSIQAFKPILIEGSAIEINPLICSAFNADFDGDTMSVHLPLSEEAQAEAREIIVSTKNIVKPASGEINASPAKFDILLGCYWATTFKEKSMGEGKYFGSKNEAIGAHDYGIVDFKAKINLLINTKTKGSKSEVIETSVGRILFNQALPSDYEFINEDVGAELLEFIIKDIFNKYGNDVLVKIMDNVKDFGFKYSTASGVTFSWSELQVPDKRKEKIREAFEETDKIVEKYNQGIITKEERKAKSIEKWQELKGEFTSDIKEYFDKNSSISTMISSGARGNYEGVSEMVAIFGVVDSISYGQIEEPVTSSLKKGLDSIEYFTTSFGARKGVADTALKTADAGFLSRRLFDVAQEINVEGKDCGTTRGYRLYRETASGVDVPFGDRVKGRYLVEDIKDNNKIIAKKGSYIDIEMATTIENKKNIKNIKVRSPITCRYAKGVCIKCYGDDKAFGKLVDVGEPVGTIAAQAIGETGTQLTMRTFHKGGVASEKGDITGGIPRIEEILERRQPKTKSILSSIDGVVSSIEKEVGGNSVITITPKSGTKNAVLNEVGPNTFIEVSVGDEVKKGQSLTDGQADLQELLEYSGKEYTQEYIYKEMSKIYELQGISISPIHFEIVIRQMFSRLIVKNAGDSTYILGEVVELRELMDENERLEKEGLIAIEAEELVTGISNVSVSRTNFLSAASFQNTKSVLIGAAINGSRDILDGIKENVIIGKLVPIGTGFPGSKKYKAIEEVKEEIKEKMESKEIKQEN